MERKDEAYDNQLYGSHVEYALGTLFLHLDDNNEELSNHLIAAIKVLKSLDHNRVIKTATEQLTQMKNPHRAKLLL